MIPEEQGQPKGGKSADLGVSILATYRFRLPAFRTRDSGSQREPL